MLTDGVSAPGDFEGLVEKIAADGITLSTVAIGEEAAGPLLQDLAAAAKGHYYFCDDVARVPQIFALETSIAGKLGITEEPFFPQVVHADAVLAGLDLEHAPTLLGYVETEPKPAGQVLLASKSGDPLLVFGRYGRGTTVAFTSDIQSRWAAAWLRWPGFGRFWGRLVRAAMRRAAARLSAPGPAGCGLGPGHARRLGPQWPIPQRRRGDAARDRSAAKGASDGARASGPRPLCGPPGDAVAGAVLSGNEAAAAGAIGGRPAAGDCAGLCRRVPHPAGQYGPSARNRPVKRRPLGPKPAELFARSGGTVSETLLCSARVAGGRGGAVSGRFAAETAGVEAALLNRGSFRPSFAVGHCAIRHGIGIPDLFAMACARFLKSSWQLCTAYTWPPRAPSAAFK